jgi:uncharacterized protein YukE
VSAARPPDFEPLASADPVPGDPDEIAMLGRRYADTAAEIAQQAANLRKLATAAPGGWKGQAGTVFHTRAADLATRISRAHGRYAAAGNALQRCAGPMSDAQQRAYSAVWQAKSAQQQMSANAPGPPRPAGGPPLTDQQRAQERAHQAAYDGAQVALSRARRDLDDAVGDYHSCASRAARQITATIEHDGLKDSWWDRNFGTLKMIFRIIGAVVLLLVVVGLIIACPWTAPLLLALGLAADTVGTLGTLITATIVIGSAAQLAFDSTAAATGKESWAGVALDLVGLAMLGYGEAVGAAVRSVAGGAAETGAAVAGARAGRAAMGAGCAACCTRSPAEARPRRPRSAGWAPVTGSRRRSRPRPAPGRAWPPRSRRRRRGRRGSYGPWTPRSRRTSPSSTSWTAMLRAYSGSRSREPSPTASPG